MVGNLVGADVGGEGELAGAQAVGAGGGFGALRGSGFRGTGAAAPVGLVGFEGERDVRAEAGHAVGAGAEGGAGEGGPVGIGADDLAAAGGEAALHREVGGAVDEADGLALCFDAVERGPVAAGDGGEVLGLVGQAGAEAEGHVFGGEGAAVVHGDVVAQGEFDGAVVDAPPGGGEAGDAVEGGAAGDEGFEDEAEVALAGVGGLLAHGVERAGVGDFLDGDGDGRAGGLGDGECRDGGGDEGAAGEDGRSLSLRERVGVTGRDRGWLG